MLHCFDLFGESFAFDSESGAFCTLDPIAVEVLRLWNEHNGAAPDQTALLKLAREKNLQPAEVLESSSEIADLVRDGAFFAKAPDVRTEQLYPDKPRIKAMCLHICHDCNLRCRYCFAGTGDFGTGVRTMLDEKTAEAAIDFLIRESGPRRHLDVDFFGGEPLMNWRVVKNLVAYCEQEGPRHGKDIRLTITTNATLLDEEKIDFINEHFKNCVLSIDGRQEVHDFMRPNAGGQGSWQKVKRNIENFVKKRGNKEYYLRGTYTAYNKDFSKDVLALADIAPQVSVEPVVCDPSLPWALHDADLPQLKAEYEKLAFAMNERRKQGKGFNFFHFMIDAGKTPCIYKRLKGCGVGSEYCAVTPAGEIYPCHQLVGDERFIMGNVLTGGLDPDSQVHEEFLKLLVPEKEACKACWARYYCGGGCVSNAWHRQQNLQGVDPFSCELLRKRLECSLWLKAKRQETAAHN